jgi:hypothetical protein
MGYTKDADSLLQKYWRMVTRGMDSVWWWRWEKMVAAADKKIGVALDPGVVVAEGSAALEMYGTPTLILHKVGKGYALLFNGDLNLLRLAAVEILARFGSKAKGARPAAPGPFADAPLGTILQSLAGIEAEIALRREDGSAMRDVEVISWENGKNDIVALFRQGGKGEPVTVTLPKAGYVYDLRNRRALGFVKAFKTEILPNRACFFAVTPRAVPEVKVQIEIGGQRPYFSPRNRALYIFSPGAQGAHAVAVTAKFPAAGKTGTDPILFGMDIVVSYSVMKPLRRIDAL